jgi:hypothetical protein
MVQGIIYGSGCRVYKGTAVIKAIAYILRQFMLIKIITYYSSRAPGF